MTNQGNTHLAPTNPRGEPKQLIGVRNVCGDVWSISVDGAVKSDSQRYAGRDAAEAAARVRVAADPDFRAIEKAVRA